MERISKQYHVHKMGGSAAPCTRVDSGTRLLFEAWDALEGDTRQAYDPTEPPELRMARVNPATGPVYINGALPGDVLEVEIHEISPVGTGYMTLRKPIVSSEEGSSEPVYTEFECRDGQILFNGALLPAYPMIGVIGTAPEKDMWTQETGDHGGNMDTSIIKKGVKLLLPVFIEGALLSMGDVHAAMGDGEIFGQGIEIGAEIDVTVRVRKDIALKRPVVINEEIIACIGSGNDIEDTAYMVVKDMGILLSQTEGLSWEEAAVLVGLYGDLKICQLVNPQKTVRIELQTKYIEAFHHA